MRTVIGLRTMPKHQGILDVDLAVGWGAPTVENVPDLSAYSLGANLTYHPLKQTRETPVSVSIAPMPPWAS